MNFLLYGVGFCNKGAELMLCAMVEHLRETFPEAGLVIASKATSSQLSRYGLKWTFGARWFRWFGTYLRYVPQCVVPNFNGEFINPKFIDGIIDASGFALSDQWNKSVGRVKLFQMLHHRGKRIVLLPQAFGPFQKPEIADYAKSIFSISDLIFPRDQQSMSFVQPLVDQSEKLHIAPDFTIFVKGVIPDDFPHELYNAVGILPNMRMLDKGDSQSKDHYISILSQGMDYLRQNDIPFFAICHQPDDNEVLSMVKATNGIDCPVIDEDDAVKIKGILGTCRLLFGSRYHGLLNGLTQGVPCIATSWSHKYHSLFHEYDCSEYLMTDLSDFSKIKRCFDQLSDPVVYQGVRQRIEKYNEIVRGKIKSMWEKVDQMFLTRK